MCDHGQPPQAPASTAEALAMAHAAADYLNGADVTGLPGQAQAEALIALGTLAAKHTAAHARLMSAFATGGGPDADGAYSAKTWLRHHTRITNGAAGAHAAWARRLAAHPEAAAALASGQLSPSWVRQLCEWTDRLPGEHWPAADEILIRAAGRGADLGDLAILAEAIYRGICPGGPEEDAGQALSDRTLYLGRTFGGAGRLEGDLTASAAAAVSAVLEALGGRSGPEDHRTFGQRNHDALAEACRRLIAAGMVPARAGQDTRAEVAISLRQLRKLPGADAAENAWIAAVAGAEPGTDAGAGTVGGRPETAEDSETAGDMTAGDMADAGTWRHGGSLAGAEAAAAACDASLVPVVSGQVNPGALEQLTDRYLAARASAANPPDTINPATRQRVKATLLRWAIEALSGPGGLASHLRTSMLGGGLANRSLPLDVGQASESIPAHLRRAVTARDRRCRFPGCYQPPGGVPGPPHHFPPRRRSDRPGKPGLALPVPSPGGDPLLGLEDHPERRWQHNRNRSRWAGPAQPRSPGRVGGRVRAQRFRPDRSPISAVPQHRPLVRCWKTCPRVTWSGGPRGG
jgi:Domain of unknown function (DUF222)